MGGGIMGQRAALVNVRRAIGGTPAELQAGYRDVLSKAANLPPRLRCTAVGGIYGSPPYRLFVALESRAMVVFSIPVRFVPVAPKCNFRVERPRDSAPTGVRVSVYGCGCGHGGRGSEPLTPD
jgi:hypothetical protein